MAQPEKKSAALLAELQGSVKKLALAVHHLTERVDGLDAAMAQLQAQMQSIDAERMESIDEDF